MKWTIHRYPRPRMFIATNIVRMNLRPTNCSPNDKPPKWFSDGVVAGLIDDMPIMKLFVRHMTSIDGKKHTQALATDHMRRVG